MGLLRDGINEVIATTHLNAAPIGIINRDEKISAMLYSGSHTYENVIRGGWLVANFTFDPVTYVKTAFGDLPEDAFQEMDIGGQSMYRLKDVEAWAAFSAEIAGRSEKGITVRLTPIKEEVISAEIHPVNRGFGNLIDATVHATRYMMNRDPGLEKMIRHHMKIVRKCGGKRELEALTFLEEIIKKMD